MRPARLVVGLVVVAAVALASFWAGKSVTQPLSDPTAGEAEPLKYTVGVDTVGRSLSFTAIGEWQLSPVGRNSAAGVVTSIEVEPGVEVGPGDVLYTVDLRPVVAAEGQVPMFRNLSLRSRGPDVVQLQALLTDAGFYSGELDGSFGSTTRSAVNNWQGSLGQEETGIVFASDIVFMPDLPAEIVLSADTVVGARLSGGEETVLRVPASPSFRIPIAPEQASLVPLTANVDIVFGGGKWEAVITRAEEAEFGQLDLLLAPKAGVNICQEVCARWVDFGKPTSFRANIIVIPETTGPAVPVAAISTDAGNNALVTLPDGSTLPVEIVESANGLAIVDGLADGTTILIPAEQ